jgi:alpha/beta superfamily hydrolase
LGGMITATSRSSPPVAQVRSVRSLELRGPAGRLEAVLNEGSPDAAFAAVIAHPHPLGGGSLHNKVVYHAMKVMNAPDFGLGWPVLRFNFRGTGRSEGEHHGTSEAGDLVAALTWLENEYKLPIVAAGFSFGAAITLQACCANEPAIAFPGLKSESCGTPERGPHGVRALVAIGLPVRSGTGAAIYDYSFLAECRIPKLFLSGDKDRFATKTELIEAAARAAEPKHVALVPGADHFFTGHQHAMQSVLAGWLREQVYDSGQRSRI